MLQTTLRRIIEIYVMCGDSVPHRPALSPPPVAIDAQTVLYECIDAVSMRLLGVVIICSSTHQYIGECTCLVHHHLEAKHRPLAV